MSVILGSGRVRADRGNPTRREGHLHGEDEAEREGAGGPGRSPPRRFGMWLCQHARAGWRQARYFTSLSCCQSALLRGSGRGGARAPGCPPGPGAGPAFRLTGRWSLGGKSTGTAARHRHRHRHHPASRGLSAPTWSVVLGEVLAAHLGPFAALQPTRVPDGARRRLQGCLAGARHPAGHPGCVGARPPPAWRVCPRRPWQWASPRPCCRPPTLLDFLGLSLFLAAGAGTPSPRPRVPVLPRGCHSAAFWRHSTPVHLQVCPPHR